MAFEGDAPVFDRPLMIIAFSNRSGSHIVSDYALQTGRIAGAGEHLNHEVIAQEIVGRQIDSLPDYIRHLDTTLAESSKVLALKASWDQLAMLLRQGIPQMFSDTLVLHCMRNDTLAQAVSYAIALRTGQWTSHQARSVADVPDIPLPEIERQVEEFNRANLLIRCLCKAHGLRHWEIGYERLCQDRGAHLTLALRAAGLAKPGWIPGAPALGRQAGPLNDRLAADFLAHVRAAAGPVQR